MIVLTSYPRSGNTFLRNVLFEVYGISSGTFLLDGHGPDKDWEGQQVVKTHHLPSELPEKLRNRKSVYLIRDGRDSMVSFAHHRKDIVAPGSDFHQNLREAIYAAEGSHFGGWSGHVETWSRQADIIIRFEELIVDPVGQCERLRAVMDLSEPNLDRLPDFESLKHGTPQYGSGKEVLDNVAGQKDMASKWFRRGKTGAWKDELPEDMLELFWHLHGETMEVAGYSKQGEVRCDFPLLGARFFENLQVADSIQVCFEASKLVDPFVDGIKRYVVEFLRIVQRYDPEGFKLIAHVGGEARSIEEAMLLDGKGTGPVSSGWLQVLKQSARVLLPDSTYNSLARAFPLQEIQGRLKRAVSATAPVEGSETQFDVSHLSLPQNYRFLPEGTKQLVGTVHDLTHAVHPEFHETNNVQFTREGLEELEARNATMIAVSASTRNDLAECGHQARTIFLGVDRRRFFRVYNQHLLNLVRSRYNLPEQKFLLTVSTLEPRKNLHRVVQAYARLPIEVRATCHLVLAGRKGWKWQDLNVPDHCRDQIHVTGFVREDHLPALYTSAHGFCYLSEYEGFGLPVLEAMACGTPVIASNVTSLPEVVGQAGILADPHSLEEISEAMNRLISDPELHQSLSTAAMHRSWEFTWSRTVEQTLAVYRELKKQ